MNYDLLLHVDSDEASLKTALRNALNYDKAGIPEKYAIALVVNGNAVSCFRQETCRFTKEIAELLGRQTTIYICRNALQEKNIAPSELIPGLVIVPAGIVQIVKLQRQGYAYVKP